MIVEDNGVGNEKLLVARSKQEGKAVYRRM